MSRLKLALFAACWCLRVVESAPRSERRWNMDKPMPPQLVRSMQRNFNVLAREVTLTDGSIRLVGSGTTDSAGLLQIHHSGEWGTVCNNDFDDNAAAVACRSLGYSLGQVWPATEDELVVTSGRTWLDAVNCDGTEAGLTECSHGGWGRHDCQHNQDVYLECDSPVIAAVTRRRLEGSVRLFGGPDAYSGRVQLYHAGTWGRVCDDQFGYSEAEVVCRMLGFSDQYAGIVPYDYKKSTAVFWLDDLNCYGDESSLLDCRHMPLGMHDCARFEDARVQCEP